MHTQGKIRISSNLSHYICGAEDGNSGLIATCDAGDYARTKEEGEANAQRLVKCWNEYDSLKAKADLHDELVEALKRYGEHSDDCMLTKEAELNRMNAMSTTEVYCDCGFEKILGKVERIEP